MQTAAATLAHLQALNAKPAKTRRAELAASLAAYFGVDASDLEEAPAARRAKAAAEARAADRAFAKSGR